MWSDRYYYWNIYKNESLSEDRSTSELRDMLNGISELEQAGDFEFKNSSSFHFIQMLILKTSTLETWSDKSTDHQKTNWIAIISSKGMHVEAKSLLNVFVPIARSLNWKLVDEETDDGVKNFVLWEPK